MFCRVLVGKDHLFEIGKKEGSFFPLPPPPYLFGSLFGRDTLLNCCAKKGVRFSSGIKEEKSGKGRMLCRVLVGVRIIFPRALKKDAWPDLGGGRNFFWKLLVDGGTAVGKNF
jgi:hypothetical protein